MSKSKSSRRWLARQHDDEFVKRALQEGYRSRAAYKLLEIQQKDRILQPGMRVVDLGASPGGWSQVAARLTGKQGQVIALDMLEMDPLPGVTFIRGDFRDDETLARLRDLLQKQPVDLVISDMAPNVSGMKAVDQPRAMYLCDLALDLAREVLKPGGVLVVKVFQGEGFDQFLSDLRGAFAKVITRKPRASRSRSREVYLVARNYNV